MALHETEPRPIHEKQFYQCIMLTSTMDFCAQEIYRYTSYHQLARWCKLAVMPLLSAVRRLCSTIEIVQWLIVLINLIHHYMYTSIKSKCNLLSFFMFFVCQSHLSWCFQLSMHGIQLNFGTW